MTTEIQEKALSQSPAAVRSRARREAAKLAKVEKELTAAVRGEGKAKATKPRKLATASPIKVSAAQKRTIGQFSAALASGFLPIASYMIAHYESATNPMLWILVAAALLFSAPSVAGWALKWTGNTYKAWGFTVLLEGVLVASHTQWLSLIGLGILVLINAQNAWTLAVRREPKGE